MLTLSMCNMFASCFSSMPICGAFTRSAVSNASGVRTPFSNFYSGKYTTFSTTLNQTVQKPGFLLVFFFYLRQFFFPTFTALITIFALTFLTPWFHYIPKATLAAVLIAAVVFLVDIQICKPLWKCCSKSPLF